MAQVVTRFAPSPTGFLHIGGVPHELLQATPGGADGSCAAGMAQADCPTKAVLAPADWDTFLKTHTQFVREWDKMTGMR